MPEDVTLKKESQVDKTQEKIGRCRNVRRNVRYIDYEEWRENLRNYKNEEGKPLSLSGLKSQLTNKTILTLKINWIEGGRCCYYSNEDGSLWYVVMSVN